MLEAATLTKWYPFNVLTISKLQAARESGNTSIDKLLRSYTSDAARDARAAQKGAG